MTRKRSILVSLAVCGLLAAGPLLQAKLTFSIPKSEQKKAEEALEGERPPRLEDFGAAEGVEASAEEASSDTVTDGKADGPLSFGDPAAPEKPKDEVMTFQPGADTVSLSEGEGRVTGTIVDQKTGQPLRGVAVLINGTDLATVTDDGGNYVIDNVPTGIYTLNFYLSGYIASNITEVQIDSMEVETLSFGLPPRPAEMADDVYNMADFTVTAEQAQTQNVALLDLRQESVASLAALSSEDFAKFAASDAAEAVSKVSGASVADGKYVVFRGLNDRYNTVLINGVILPSPDPDRKAVPLDIFPTGLVDQIVVSKTFTADQPGESSGGSINLITKSIPDEPFLKFSVGGGGQVNTTGKEVLMDPEAAGFKEWLKNSNSLGYTNRDGGTALLSNYANQVGGANYPLMAPVRKKAEPDRSFGISFGGSMEPNENVTIGGVFGLNAGTNTRATEGIIDETNIEDGFLVKGETGTLEKGAVEHKGSLLAGLGIRFFDKLSLNYAYIRAETLISEATERLYETYDDERADLVTRLDTELYTDDRVLQSHQFSGDYTFDIGSTEGWEINWSLAGAQVEQKEPDRRIVSQIEVFDDGSLGYSDVPGSPPIIRFDRQTNTDSRMYGLDLKSPEMDITDDVAISFMVGFDIEDSKRSFVQLESLIDNELVVDNPVYAALPPPDGSGFLYTGTEGEFTFSGNPEGIPLFNDDFFGVRDLIDGIYSEQIDFNLPGEINVAQETVDRRQDTFDMADESLMAAQTALDGGLAAFENLFGVPWDPNTTDPLQILIAQQLIIPNEIAVAEAQVEFDTAETRLATANENLATKEGQLPTIESEFDQFTMEADALVLAIQDMPSLATDPTAFPTYSYFGDDNYILNTPVGFSLYSDSAVPLGRTQFPAVSSKIQAKGVNKVESLFMSGELRILEKFRIATGARIEDTRLSYERVANKDGEPPAQTTSLGPTFDPVPVDNRPIDQIDVLPFVSLIFEATENLKFQFSYSKTVAKPTFREIAPFPIFNLSDRSIEVGNPGRTKISPGAPDDNPDSFLLPEEFSGLEIADVRSTDFRIEYFTPLDGLVAFGVFRKEIEAPIERVLARRINGVDINTFINNNNDADLYGFEFELQQNLGVLHDDLSWVTIGGNYALLEAEVERSDFEKANYSPDRFSSNPLLDPDSFITGENSTRPLFDQPAYTANAFVTFDFEKTGTSLTLSGNWIGEQLKRVGGLTDSNEGTADLYLDDFVSINIVLQQKIGEHWTLKVGAKNINSPDRILYEDPSLQSILANPNIYDFPPQPGDPASTRTNQPFRSSLEVRPSYFVAISGSF